MVPHSIETIGAKKKQQHVSGAIPGMEKRILDYAEKVSQDGMYLELLDAAMFSLQRGKVLHLVLPYDDGETLALFSFFCRCRKMSVSFLVFQQAKQIR